MAATAGSAKIKSGKWKLETYVAPPSVLLSHDVLVQVGVTGVIEATTTAGATDTPLVGIYIGPTLTAASLTVSTNILVAVPAEPLCVAELAIDTGTPSQHVDIGKSFDISATGGVTFSTTTNEPVTFKKYISATLGDFYLTNMSSPAA